LTVESQRRRENILDVDVDIETSSRARARACHASLHGIVHYVGRGDVLLSSPFIVGTTRDSVVDFVDCFAARIRQPVSRAARCNRGGNAIAATVWSSCRSWRWTELGSMRRASMWSFMSW